MEFANPKCLFLLLLLVPLVVWYVVKLRHTQANFKLSSTSAFTRLPSSWRVSLRHLPFILRTLAIALVILVIARPQSVTSYEKSKSQGIDIVIALDVSGTMLARDFKPDRLEAAKSVAAEFIAARENDKIGLVVFGGESFTQCPLTTDRRVLLNLLRDVRYGMIENGTAIGLGLANSVNRLKDSKSKSKVIILLTDGSNNRGQIAPLTAAELAKGYDIRVYTIGVGTRGMAPMPVAVGSEFTQMEPVDIDERTLTEIASITGGEYFRATDNNSLKNIYNKIDEMEKYLISVNQVTRRKELFMPFAILALGLIVCELVLRRTTFRNIP
ncbi:Ca-activated chloride channel family protein [Dysgonomonas sp. PH5-45]|uniref:vWA domain-containing protein n=1 Tax=unclassified Dysgonomonas TaxID=2630389 RepID=UPI0024770C72|nr:MULTISPECIES: VWA domain-containing protein [unclassified Dysgonomonas]MDH6355560.1 Ca-activated chloride channel family protein [Dysgonomonas sp. PH5-45]MDH6388457.1 Ca-activated chloride channel family protein [Dysgonomonas sp. PH5-37]